MGSESSEVATEVTYRLRRFLGDNPAGRLFGADLVVALWPGEKPTARKPDVAYVRKDRLPEGKSPRGHLNVVPDLVVEVVSEHDLANELNRKLADYRRAGIPLIWVVDPATMTVITWHGDEGQFLGADDVITGGDALPGLECPVRELFPPGWEPRPGEDEREIAD